MTERRAQAYGEVLWFGGRVTALTLVSFIFMVCDGAFGEMLLALRACAGRFVHDCGVE